MEPVRVRFAPSPTGHMHLGSARTALYDYLIAKQTGGQFILRIEDTDRNRYVEGAEEELIDGLRWLGIDFDEGPGKEGPFGPYRQSERKEIYRKHAEQLVENGHAYYCFCTPERLTQVRQEQQKNKEIPHYDGLCRNLTFAEARKRVESGEKYVIRFKSPWEGKTTVHDEIRGDITVENRTIDDYIIVKSDGWALYHLAAMVDDHEMKITHVIRGSEWLPTFPLHALIVRAFGWEEPKWLHLSVFLKPSGKGKMSKREAADLMKDGYSIFVKDLKNLGYLPEAVNNWIALMGWSYDDHTELFELDDLVEKFSLDHLNPSPAAINFTKLDHFNGLHIRKLKSDQLAERIEPFFKIKYKMVDKALLKRIAPAIQERIGTLDEAVVMAGFFFEDKFDVEHTDLIVKGLIREQAFEILTKARDRLMKCKSWFKLDIEESMRELVTDVNLTNSQVFSLLRMAVTGQKVSPPLFDCIEILGSEKVLRRLGSCINMLNPDNS